MEALECIETRDRHAKSSAEAQRAWGDIDSVAGKDASGLADTLLPDGFSKTDWMPLLDAGEKRLLSQIQGRTYANIFGLVEHFIAAKTIKAGHPDALSDPTAAEGLGRLGEALRRQQMFRRIEHMAAAGMAEGYTFAPEANAVAAVALGKSTWAVLALICHIESFVLAHYRQSIDLDTNLSASSKDALLYHWSEESQHAQLAEQEWLREDARLNAQQRDRAVDDLIDLLAAVDALLQRQSRLDADYFLRVRWRSAGPGEPERIRMGFSSAYRWQYIVGGVRSGYGGVLIRLTTPAQQRRVAIAIATLLS